MAQLFSLGGITLYETTTPFVFVVVFGVRLDAADTSGDSLPDSL